MAALRTGESLLMTVEECASLLKCSDVTVTELVKSGQWIGARKSGNRYIISRAAFERLYLDGVWHSENEPRRNPLLVSLTDRKVAS